MKHLTHLKLSKHWVRNSNGSAVEFKKFLRGENVSHLELDTEIHPAWSIHPEKSSSVIAQRQEIFNTKYSFNIKNKV